MSQLTAILIFAFTASLASELTAKAQYPAMPGYGWTYGGLPGNWYGWGLPYRWDNWRYGWGAGFGGASTVPGSILGGWGAYLNGAGIYNRDTAIANAINVDTWMRWAAAVNQTQMRMNYSNYLRRQRRHARIVDARRRIFERLRDNPNISDIRNGDAINVKLRILMNPGYSARVVEELQVPVETAVIEQLVVTKPAEGISANLKRLRGAFDWPMALRARKFASLRAEVEKSTQTAWEELISAGYVEPVTLSRIHQGLAEVRTALDADFGTIDQSSYANGRNFLKDQMTNTRAFSSEGVTGFFRDITTTPTPTLGKILESLTIHGMQFAPAKDASQFSVYERLYAVLRGAPPTVLTPETFSEVFAESGAEK